MDPARHPACAGRRHHVLEGAFRGADPVTLGPVDPVRARGFGGLQPVRPQEAWPCPAGVGTTAAVVHDHGRSLEPRSPARATLDAGATGAYP